MFSNDKEVTKMVQNFNIGNIKGHVEMMFEGEIDAFMISQFKGRIDRYMDKHWGNNSGGNNSGGDNSESGIIVNLDLVSFIDSHAVGLFVSLLKRAHNAGTKLVFTGVKGQPLSILKIVGFNDGVVCYADNVEEAVVLIETEQRRG